MTCFFFMELLHKLSYTIKFPKRQAWSSIKGNSLDLGTFWKYTLWLIMHIMITQTVLSCITTCNSYFFIESEYYFMTVFFMKSEILSTMENLMSIWLTKVHVLRNQPTIRLMFLLEFQKRKNLKSFSVRCM